MSASQKRCEAAKEQLRGLNDRIDSVLDNFQSFEDTFGDKHGSMEVSTRGSMLDFRISGPNGAGRRKHGAKPKENHIAKRPRSGAVTDDRDGNGMATAAPRGPHAKNGWPPAGKLEWKDLQQMVSELLWGCPSPGNLISKDLPEVPEKNAKKPAETSRNAPSATHTPSSSAYPLPDDALVVAEEMRALPETLADQDLVTPGIPSPSSKKNPAPNNGETEQKKVASKGSKRSRSQQGNDASKRPRAAKDSANEHDLPPRKSHEKDGKVPAKREQSVEVPSPATGTPQHRQLLSGELSANCTVRSRSSTSLSASFRKMKGKAEKYLQEKQKELYTEVAMAAAREGIQWAVAKEEEYRENPDGRSPKDVIDLLSYMSENFLKKAEASFRVEFPNEELARQCSVMREKLRLRKQFLAHFSSDGKRRVRSLREGLQSMIRSDSDTKDQETLRKTLEVLSEYEKAVDVHRRLIHQENGRQSVPVGKECTIS